MKKLAPFIFLILTIGCSINKANQEEIITYHELTKKEKRINGRIIKEKYQLKPSTKIKHGKYERFDKNFIPLERGYYKNGIKSSVWEIWNAEDQIIIKKDFDQGGTETPVIEKEYLNYPVVLVEQRDSLPEGVIIMGLEFNSDCTLNQLKILQGIDPEFDNTIANRYKRYSRLSHKYGIPITECVQKKDSLIINFKL